MPKSMRKLYLVPLVIILMLAFLPAQSIQAGRPDRQPMQPLSVYAGGEEDRGCRLTYTQVSGGGYHTCGLRSDGNLSCWGRNDQNQIIVPALPAGLTYTQVSAGAFHTCALRSNGTAVCWGFNNNGQATVPALAGGLTYTQISAGNGHTCGLVSDGTITCWGQNDYTQTTVPALAGGLTYTRVSTGEAHSCGLISDGTVDCWGNNAFWQTEVVALPGGLTYTQVDSGGFHSCGLRSDGTAVCWGSNSSGQLTVPALAGGLTYTQVSVGKSHTCGRVSDGTLNCWGSNSYGQTTVPALAGGLTYTQVSAAREYHTCGLVSDGTLACWGYNSDGETDVPVILTLHSTGTLDGWVLESGETSNVGGTLNNTAVTISLGDNAADKQYRAILSFNTATLPNDAVITKVTLSIKPQSTIGTSPFTTHGGLLVDIRKGAFNSNSALELVDFQAAALPGLKNIGNLPKVPTGGWYTRTWTGSIFPYINRVGITQFRLRFSKDDNDDTSADYMKFFSGDYATFGDRPTLVVEYTVP